ncbi:MAG: tetratricopeptide repeat protein, partial [Xenococcaceae cyanobacterium MO_188.B29]|nr:tetratricopeptide repeat protein [Xenococcaceae cyanobacterium MO_188.B29]
EEIYAQHQAWGKLHRHLAIKHDFIPERINPQKKLRIGYVSGDFTHHPVAYFLQPLFANSDRSNFEIFCYANNVKTDAFTNKLKQLAHTWREIHHLNDKQVADLIKEDKIDILVDLAGHNGGNRLLVFAYKPAPIQVTYLGYADTTGLETVDYRFTDAYADPEGKTEHLHTEQLIRLPQGFLCYQPSANSPQPAPPPVITNNYITFGSFNNIAKVSPEIIYYWAEILKQVPNSRLILKYRSLNNQAVRDRIYNLFAQYNITRDRLELKGRIPDKNEHLAFYSQIDIALDTYPYHGTTTTCEALWMGVPVITLAGKVHVSRVGVSLLSAVGLTEFITASPEVYINKAVDLANNINKLTELRKKIRPQMEASPLTDGKAIAQSIELAYRQMWQDWCQEKSEVRSGVIESPSYGVFASAPKKSEVETFHGTSVQNSEVAGNIEQQYVGAQALRPSGEKKGENAYELNNLGVSYIQQGKFEQAILTFKQALAIKPECAEAHNNLGQLYQEQKQFVAAQKHLQQAIKLAPHSPQPYYHLGLLYQAQDKKEQAVKAYRSAIEQDKTYADAYNNLGNVYKKLGQFNLAFAAYEQAIKLQPTKAIYYYNLGNGYQTQRSLTEAIACYQKTIELQPDYASAYNNLAKTYKERGDLEQAILNYRQAVALQPNNGIFHPNLLFSLNYSSSHTPLEIYQEHLNWANNQSVEVITSHYNHPHPDRKLRIGYVSGDLYSHSVSYFFEPLLVNCERRNFTTICYSNNSKTDVTTIKLKQLADSWREIQDLDDKQVIKLIQQDRIDILVDLSGHSKHNRLLVFAAKPAPIQVTYLGYPNTTGLSTIDYRFTDANADPEGATEHLHTEKLIRLPNSFLGYQPPANAPTISPPPVVKNNYITFGSFNNIAKVSPQIIRIWANILKQVPNSRLLLKYKVLDDRSTCDRLYQLFEQEGIEPNRLDLQGWIENISNHLACYHHIDIALDTYPYHGTTTTCEALWMGVPVITLAGEVHVSRVGVSLLSSVGLNEFIADSPEEYISKAVDLAHNIDKLTELRANLRSQIEKSPLTDGKAIAQSIESAYRQMWQEWCNTVGAKGIRPAEEAGDNIISFRGEIKLAQDYCHQGEFEAAIGCLQSILQIKPDNLEAWNLLGNIYRQQDKLILAIEAYQQLVKLQPSNVAALNNLGVLYLQQQESDRAIATFKQVIELAPDYAEAYSNLGQLYGKLNNLDQAQTYLEQAITLKPNFATAYFNLGSIYKNQGKLSAAIVSYQQAAAIEPSADIYSNLASVYKDRGNLAETVNSYQKCLAIEPAHLVAQQNLLFCLHYSSAYSPEQIYHQHQAWGKQYPVGKQNFSLTKPTPDKKLRIGYVSGDFKHHPVAFFLEPILTNCARDNFDIFCYVNNSEIDATTTRLKQLADGWREIHALADKEVSKLIQQDRIDILVDLSGHSGHNRLLVFAHKPAPIQIIYLGYPDTTGLASIDYRLTDNYADPIGKTEHLHTETLIRLPNSFLCYQPPANTPQTSSPPVITNKYITFGSFNNIAKVSPQIIHCWANILKQVPSSRLLLKYKALGDRGTRDRIYNLFAQSGIESNRLDLRGWVEGINNHLAAYSQIDIALDTYPYHGTTTTCEALWMGVPVITLAGKAHVSRVGVSLLSSVGLKEFIAQSPEEYVRKAVDLANNTTKLAELREQLRTQIKSSPLTDGKAIARSIESAYRHVYDDWYKKSHLSQPKVTKNKFKMQKAIFFISTGRCGTQWLATTLSKLYSDLAVVTHEPIKAQYQPNNFFRALDRFEELQNIPAVRQHLHQLENIPPDKLYIETGWTSFAAIPLFINLFKDKIKLVNVVRHPVNMACSMVTHNFYQPEIRNDEFTRLAQLDPYTPGIVQTNYQDIWNQMTPYEKCLFFWNEIHLYAQEIHQNYPEIPYLQIRMEDLLNPQSKTINNLLDFLDLPFRKEIKEQFKHHVDHYQLKTKLNLDWKQVFKHDQTISLTQHFGYDFTQIAKQDLDKRYLSTSTFTPIKLNVFAERIIDNSYSFLVIAFLTEGYKEEGLRLLKSLEQTQLSYCIYQVPSVHQSISLKGKAESLDYTKPNFLASVKNNIDRRNFQSTRKVAFTNILYLDCDMVFIPDNEKINEIQSWCDRGIDFAIYNWLGDKENCTAYTSISRDLKTWMISHGNRMGYHPEYLLCSGCTQFYSLSANSLIIWQTWQKLLKEYSENILSQHNAIFPGDDHFLDYAWNNILKKNTNIKFLWLTKEYARYPWWPWVKPSIDHPNNPSSDYRPFLPNRLPSLAFNRQETSDFIKGNYSEKNITGVSYQILEEVNDKVDSLDNLSLLEVQRIVKHLHRLGKTQLALKISQQALQLEPSNPEFTKLVEMFK